jgi:hypothetical protein
MGLFQRRQRQYDNTARKHYDIAFLIQHDGHLRRIGQRDRDCKQRRQYRNCGYCQFL